MKGQGGSWITQELEIEVEGDLRVQSPDPYIMRGERYRGGVLGRGVYCMERKHNNILMMRKGKKAPRW